MTTGEAGGRQSLLRWAWGAEPPGSGENKKIKSMPELGPVTSSPSSPSIVFLGVSRTSAAATFFFFFWGVSSAVISSCTFRGDSRKAEKSNAMSLNMFA